MNHELFLSVSGKNMTQFNLMTEYNDMDSYEEKVLFCSVFSEAVYEIFKELKTVTVINNSHKPLQKNLLNYMKLNNHPFDFGVFEHKKGIDKDLLTAFMKDRIDDFRCESGDFGCIATETEVTYPQTPKDFDNLFNELYSENFFAKAVLMDCFHNDGSIYLSDRHFNKEDIIGLFNKICASKSVKLNVSEV